MGYTFSTMSLRKEDLERSAQLAYLTISEEEIDRFLPQFNTVLGFMKSLDDFDLSNVEPTSTVLDGETPLREDVVVDQPDLLLEKNAPVFEDQCFKVPKILG